MVRGQASSRPLWADHFRPRWGDTCTLVAGPAACSAEQHVVDLWHHRQLQVLSLLALSLARAFYIARHVSAPRLPFAFPVTVVMTHARSPRSVADPGGGGGVGGSAQPPVGWAGRTRQKLELAPLGAPDAKEQGFELQAVFAAPVRLPVGLSKFQQSGICTHP